MCDDYLKFFIFCCILQCIFCDHYYWGEMEISQSEATSDDSTDNFTDVGEPLILTPYIENNSINTARNLSLVQPEIGGWQSYTGFFTVNEECGNNIFFWFVPAKNNWEKAPVLMWLQGGPGSSSLFGLFEEIGPFNSFPGLGITPRNDTWNTNHNIIYMDQPVGTGFSFSVKECYAENMTAVTEESYSALVQFFKMFPELQKNKFYITGESFGGHYIPVLAAAILNKNPTSELKINIVGVLVGNPLIKLSCHNYSQFLYEWGTIDKNLETDLSNRHGQLKLYADSGRYLEAWQEWANILSLFRNKTGYKNQENMVNQPPDLSDYDIWVNTTKVRKNIKVGNITFNDISLTVYEHLKSTIAESQTSYVEEMLEKNISVGFYSGNLDLICLYTSLECTLRNLTWSGAEDYRNANRSAWYLNGEIRGWFKIARLLYEIVVKDAGHSVPTTHAMPMVYVIETVTSVDPGVNPATKFNTTEP